MSDIDQVYDRFLIEWHQIIREIAKDEPDEQRLRRRRDVAAQTFLHWQELGGVRGSEYKPDTLDKKRYAYKPRTGKRAESTVNLLVEYFSKNRDEEKSMHELADMFCVTLKSLESSLRTLSWYRNRLTRRLKYPDKDVRVKGNYFIYKWNDNPETTCSGYQQNTINATREVIFNALGNDRKGVKELAALTGFTERKVQAACKKLLELGELERFKLHEDRPFGSAYNFYVFERVEAEHE